MQEQDIINILTQIGKDLEDEGFMEPVRLLLIGGGYMVTQIHNRATTMDIDAGILTPTHRYGEIYELFRKIVDFNLAEIGGDPRWYSDDISEFLPLMGLPTIRTLWLSSGKIEVYVPDAEYILVLKLLANRDKDQEDIRVLLGLLKIKRRKQAEVLLRTYVSEDIRDEYAQKLETVLKAWFPQR